MRQNQSEPSINGMTVKLEGGGGDSYEEFKIVHSSNTKFNIECNYYYYNFNLGDMIKDSKGVTVHSYEKEDTQWKEINCSGKCN